MKRKWKKMIMIAALTIGISQSAVAGEIWSDGDFELGPSTPTQTTTGTTELWSESLWNDPAPAPVTTLPASAPAPQINGNPVALSFDVPPVIENGRTLVPVRNILEPLGAVLDWDPVKQLVTAQKGDTTIHLIINLDRALVNGEQFTLDVPAKIINSRTFVPLRFISETLGYKVDYDPATTKVTIADSFFFHTNPSKATASQSTQPSKPVANTNPYIGNWAIWVPGGFATTGSTLNGDGSTTITQEYVQGAKGKVLSIKADGTYTWDTPGGVINGTWKPDTDGKIVLLNGQMDSDWYVTQTKDGIKWYAWGMEEHGTRIQ